MALAVAFQIGSLGDTIVSVPSLLSLRDLTPDCSEYLLVTGFQGERKVHPGNIFDMAWPAKGKLNYQARGNFVERYASYADVLARLRYYRPRYAAYLLPTQRSQQQVDRDKLFFRAGGVRELLGFRTISETERHREEGISLYTTETFLRFKRLWNERAEERFNAYCPHPLLRPTEGAVATVRTWLAAHRRKPTRGLVAICPFSNASARDMEPGTVVALVKRLEGELQVETILLGGKKDRSRVEAIVGEAGTGLNACGVFAPAESGALFCQCVLAICVDSGPLHLAGAVGLPTVSAYASVNQPFHNFLPLGKEHTILYQTVGCAGCGSFVCPVEGHPCMKKTTAEQLFAAVRAKLTNSLIPQGSLNGTHLLRWPN